MRILFVSGTSIGGSARSTQALARRMAARGHDAAVLVRPDGRPVRTYLHKRQVNLTTKLGDRAGARPLLAIQRQMGRIPRRLGGWGVPAWASTFPENAYPGLHTRLRPDVVVASSIDRVSWRRLRAEAQARGVPTVLYLREANALGHLTISHAPPDLLVANATRFVDEAEALGHRCLLVPSVVETDDARVKSTRRALLVVNPIESHGVATALAVARARPNVPVVLQESWPLDRGARRALANLPPNVELRPLVADPRQVYRDARVLLVPHRLDNRPRVVMEAQANGIPVVASRWPGLVEAVGPGGVLVDPDAPLDAWLAAIARVWDDPAAYDRLAAAARAHAARDEVDPDRVTDRFEEALAGLVAPIR